MQRLALSMLLFLQAPRVASAVSPYEGAPLQEEVLDLLRGGVLLPNGLDVALGFDLRTMVDGQLALHTVLSTELPSPDRLRVLVGPKADPMPDGQAVELPSPTTPELLLDRRGAGTTVAIGTTGAALVGGRTVVNVVTAPREQWPAYVGETEISPTLDGPAVGTALGAVTLRQQTGGGSVITLSGESLVIQHLIGQATGVAVLNAASDRRIDTVSTLDVDVKGGWVNTANGLFGISAIAADAATLHR